MNQYNVAMIQGRMTFEPDIKTLVSGKQLAKLRLACKSSRGTLYMDVDIWEDSLISLAKELKKGEEVKVVGEIRSNTWETPTGEKRMKHLIVAEELKRAHDGEQAPITFDAPF